jgi:hypothetical protein
MRTKVVCLLLSFLIAFNSGCEKGSALRTIGEDTTIIDPAPPPPTTLDLVVDEGGGSKGASKLRASLSKVVPTLAPGSVVRLEPVADTVATSSELSRFVITAPRQRSRRAIAAHRQKETDALIAQFLTAAQPLFKPGVRRASPIAQTIVRAVLAGNESGGVHHIIYIGDARQYSKGDALGRIDAECSSPDPEEFTRRLGTIVHPEDLRGVVIHFAGITLTPVENDRCPATIEQYRALQHLWVTSFTRLGARVTWSMEPLTSLD